MIIFLISACCTSCADSKTINVPVEVTEDTPGAEQIITNEPGTQIPKVTYVKYMDVEFKPYGVFNKSDNKNDMIEYDWTGGNLFWSIVFSETIVVPILIVGYDWWEPQGLKREYNATNITIAPPKQE